jgi:hypothetical protein
MNPWHDELGDHIEDHIEEHCRVVIEIPKRPKRERGS